MMSVEIEPQYLAPEDEADAEYDSVPMLASVGGINHQMMVDGVMSLPGMESADDYGEEVEGLEAPEFSKMKRDKVFISADHTRRKTKMIGTLG